MAASSVVPHQLFDRLALGLVVVLLATALTALEVTKPSMQSWRSDLQTLADRLPHAATKQSPAKPQPKPATKPAAPVAKPTPAPVVAATPPPAATNSATTNSFVHLREGKSVSTAIILNLNAGTVVQLTDDADATWQGVIYQGKSGYIYRTYLQYQPTATPAHQ